MKEPKLTPEQEKRIRIDRLNKAVEKGKESPTIATKIKKGLKKDEKSS